MSTLLPGTLAPQEQQIIRLIARKWRTQRELNELLGHVVDLDQLLVDKYIAVGGIRRMAVAPGITGRLGGGEEFLYCLGTAGGQWLILQARIKAFDLEVARLQTSDAMARERGRL